MSSQLRRPRPGKPARTTDEVNSPEDASDFEDSNRPVKRKKLGIRGKKSADAPKTTRQPTRDRFGVVKASPQKRGPADLDPDGVSPPNKVGAPRSHYRLVETVNGNHNEVSVHEDELEQTDGAPSAESPRPGATGQAAHAGPKSKQGDTDRRILRSQVKGPKLKTDLASFCANYEDIMSNHPTEKEDLTVDTVLYVYDDTTADVKSEQTVKSPKGGVSNASHRRNASTNGVSSAPSTPQHRPESSTNQLNGYQILNLDMIANSVLDTSEDPLPDDYYDKSHRREERKEKHSRNVDKERFMHEQVQLDRLLDGLLGHDWLKTLGITGITGTEARKYEPKRAYFLAFVRSLVEKYRRWKEAEKQFKVKREAVTVARAIDSLDGSVDLPASDLNASAARQLQQETASAIKKAPARRRPNQPTAKASRSSKPPLKSLPVSKPPPTPKKSAPLPDPEEPISSFYNKRHLRDAALGNARHGRNSTAFGHPLPELEVRDFDLPSEYPSEDMLRANAREQRRRRREALTEGGPHAQHQHAGEEAEEERDAH